MKLCLRCNQYFEDQEELCPNDKTKLEPVGKDPLIGALINNRYVVESVIGKGSSGIVYKATRLMMGGDIAVKVIHSYLGADGNSLERLLRELKAAEKLRHPHIITVWESGITDDGQPYLVMDYLEGITLSALLKQKGALTVKRVLSITKQVVDALTHAHDQGLIHRDMKPENIILEENESQGDYVKVLDFGIAETPAETAASKARPGKTKTVAGSPAYMSPEQCQGFELDFRSDLYSVAVICFEMLTGRRPFVAPDLMKLMYKTVTEPAPLMGEIRKDIVFSDALEAVIAKALSKNPEDRQDSLRQFWSELEAAGKNTSFVTSEHSKRNYINELPLSEHDFFPTERLTGESAPMTKGNFAKGPEDDLAVYLAQLEGEQAVDSNKESKPESKPASPPPAKPSAPPAPNTAPSKAPVQGQTPAQRPQGAPPAGGPQKPPGAPGAPRPTTGSMQKPGGPAPGQRPAGAPGAPAAPGAPRPTTGSMQKPGGPGPNPNAPRPATPGTAPGAPGQRPPTGNMQRPTQPGSSGQPGQSGQASQAASGQRPAMPPQSQGPTASQGKLAGLVRKEGGTASAQAPAQPKPPAGPISGPGGGTAPGAAKTASQNMPKPPSGTGTPGTQGPSSPAGGPPKPAQGAPNPQSGAPRPVSQNMQRPPGGPTPQGAPRPQGVPGPNTGSGAPGAPRPVSQNMQKPAGPGAAPSGAKPASPGSPTSSGVPKPAPAFGPGGANTRPPQAGGSPQQKPGAPISGPAGAPIKSPLPTGSSTPPSSPSSPSQAQNQPKPPAPASSTVPVSASAPPTPSKELDGIVGKEESLQEKKARFSNLNWDDELDALKDDHNKPSAPVQSGAWDKNAPVPVIHEDEEDGYANVSLTSLGAGSSATSPAEPPAAPIAPVAPAAQAPQVNQPTEQTPPMSQSQQMQGMPGYPPGMQPGMPQMPQGQMPYYPGYQYPQMPGYPPMYPAGYPQMPYDPNMQWQGQMPPYGVQSGTGYTQVPYPGMPDPQALAQAQAMAQAQGQIPQIPGQMPLTEGIPVADTGTIGSASTPVNPLDADDDPFTQHVTDFESEAKSTDSSSLPISPLDKDDDPFAAVSKSTSEDVDLKAQEQAEQDISALLEAKLKEDDPFKNVTEPSSSPASATPVTPAAPVQEERSAEDILDSLLNSRLKEENPPAKAEVAPTPANRPLKLDDDDNDLSELGALLKAKLTGSSEEEKKPEPPKSSSALGQLLGALQEEEEEEDSPAPKKEEAAQSSLGSALNAAVDDMFTESALKANPDVQQVGLGDFKGLKSLNATNEANSEIADAVDKWLDNVESGAAKKEGGFGAVAAKLSEIMGDDEEDKPPVKEEPKAFDGVGPGEKKSSHTSDALSRLLAAASMATETPASKSYDSMNPVGGSAGPSTSVSGLPSTPFGPEPYQNDSTSSSQDKFGQDAINAKIAEMNRRLEQQSQSMSSVNLDHVQHHGSEPQAVQDSRNVVNRIMEEAYAKQQAMQQAPVSQNAPYPEAPGNAGGFSREELEQINNSKLAYMAQAEAARNKGNLRSRQSSFALNPSYVISGLLVVVIGAVGYFGFTQNWFGGMFGNSGSQTKELTVSERDAKVSQEVDELMKSGQIAKAISTLQDYNDKYDGLTAELESKLDKAYIALAKHHASTGDNSQAADILKNVPSTSKHFAEAQKLLKKYKGGRSARRKSRH